MKSSEIPLSLLYQNPITSALAGVMLSKVIVSDVSSEFEKFFKHLFKNIFLSDGDVEEFYPFSYGSIYEIFGLLKYITIKCYDYLNSIENQLLKNMALILSYPALTLSYATSIGLETIGRMIQFTLNTINALSVATGIENIFGGSEQECNDEMINEQETRPRPLL